jgi:hypothetical protein
MALKMFIEGTSGNLQDAAHKLNIMDVFIVVDEMIDGAYFFANMAMAFFNISFSSSSLAIFFNIA